jgi:hypothetical protein
MRFLVFALVALLVGLTPTVAHADDASADVAASVGAAPSGLPGLARVAVASPREAPHAGAAVSAGYGITEAQSRGGAEFGPHHRAFGTIGLMAQPLRFFAAAVTFDGRYDKHPADALGPSSSVVGEPRFIVRANEALGRAFALGAEFRLWVPGAEAPSLRPDASTLDAQVLATYAPPGSGFALAFNGGYRLDHSANVLDAKERRVIRRGDLLSLHLSDFDAVLVGIGASKRFGKGHSRASRFEGFGEATWDILLGKEAPSAISSPLRAGIGARYHLNEDSESFGALELEARTEVLCSEHLSNGPATTLVPIDPRFAFALGAKFTPSFGKAPARPETGAPPPSTVAPAAHAARAIRGRLTDEAGGAVPNARVSVTPIDGDDGTERTVEANADGSFAVTEMRAGRAHLVATAPGYEEASTDVTLDAPDVPAEVSVQIGMKKVVKRGQLRGLVRSFDGKALAATVRVEPLGIETKTDSDGLFRLDVPVGSYEVVIEATGHSGQRRPVSVEENGVTVLNADLRPGKAAP